MSDIRPVLETIVRFSVWHAAILFESALLVVLHKRRTGLKWFESLIGVDLVVNLAQLSLYRLGYREFSRLMWVAGVILLAPLNVMAVVESAGTLSLWRTRTAQLHVMLLAGWVSAQLACAYLATQPGWNHGVNRTLLVADVAVFAAWMAIW